MARKKIIPQSSFTSWEDVNEALRQIAEKQSVEEGVLAKNNEAEARRRKAVDEKINPLKAEIEKLEENMRLFCEENREDFGNKKSKELNNGVVNFRTGTPKAKTIKGFTWKAVIEVIKRSDFVKRYIRIKEDVNKEAIIQDHTTGEIDNETLKTLGVKVVQEETFGYEVFVASNQGEAA